LNAKEKEKRSKIMGAGSREYMFFVPPSHLVSAEIEISPTSVQEL
jgi:hypothetical protein